MVLKSDSSPMSVLHAYCGTLGHTMQRLQLISFLSGFRSDFYIAHSCYLLQVSLSEHHVLETVIYSQLGKDAKNFVWPIFLELCMKLYTFWLFFTLFCCCANAQNKAA